MNEFIICIMISNICGTLLLFAGKRMRKQQETMFEKRMLYVWMKITLCGFLFPFIAGGIRLCQMYRVIISPTANCPDFLYWITCRDLAVLRKRELFPAGLWQISLLFFIWIAGVVGRYWKLHWRKDRNLKAVRQHAEQVREGEAFEILQTLAEELSVRRNIGLYRSVQIISPILIGIRKPCIIIPKMELSAEELRLIIRHELEHYKCGDLIIKRILSLIKDIYWFNPLTLKCLSEFEQFGELACDERVSEALEKKERTAYAQVLIKLKKAEYNCFYGIYRSN